MNYVITELIPKHLTDEKLKDIINQKLSKILVFIEMRNFNEN